MDEPPIEQDESPVEHERPRLHRLADEFIESIVNKESYEDADINYEDVVHDPRLNVVMVIGIMNWEDEDGDKHELPVSASETQSIYAQIGILESVLSDLKSRFHTYHDD